MPVADKKWFKQTEELSTDLAKKLSTSSFGTGSLDTLESLGWEVRGSDKAGVNARQQASQAQPIPPTGCAVEGAGSSSCQQAIPRWPWRSPFRKAPRSASMEAPCPVTSCRASHSSIFFAKAGNIIFPTDWSAYKISARHPCEPSATWTKPRTPVQARNRRWHSSSSQDRRRRWTCCWTACRARPGQTSGFCRSPASFSPRCPTGGTPSAPSSC